MLGEGFLKPEEALDSWDIRPGEHVADFGCGAGFFTAVMGKRVGPKGAIYAIDVRSEALDATRAKVKLFGLSNVNLIRGDLEEKRGTSLADESVQKVLVTNILFQVPDKAAILAEATRILKPAGSLMLIEWDTEKEAIKKPVLPGAVTKAEAKRLLENAGFVVQKETYAGSHHYGLIAQKHG